MVTLLHDKPSTEEVIATLQGLLDFFKFHTESYPFRQQRLSTGISNSRWVVTFGQEVGNEVCWREIYSLFDIGRERGNDFIPFPACGMGGSRWSSFVVLELGSFG